MNCAAKLEALFKGYWANRVTVEGMSLAHNPSRGLNGAFLKGQSRYVDVRCASDESGVLVSWRDQTNPDYRSDMKKYPIQVLSVGDAARVAEAVLKMVEHFLGSYPLDSVLTQVATQATATTATSRGTSPPARTPSMSELAELAERFGVHLRELERLRMQIDESQDLIQAARAVIDRLLSNVRGVDIKLREEPYAVELVDAACSLIVGASPSIWSVRRYNENRDEHAYANSRNSIDPYKVLALHQCEWVLSAGTKLGSDFNFHMVVEVEPLVRHRDMEEMIKDLAEEHKKNHMEYIVETGGDLDEELLDDDTYLMQAEQELNREYPSWLNEFPLSGDPARDLEAACGNILEGLGAMPVEDSFFACDELDGEVERLEDELRARGVLR